MASSTLLVDGLAFAEGPRWHDGRLWYSDMHRQVVEAVDLEGTVETICEVPQDPSGLGWLPDGHLLVVSMRDRRVMRLDSDGKLHVHADLWELASFHLNDMVVDAAGRAYVGNFGFDLHGDPPAEPGPAELIIVEADGTARVGADHLLFPNGSVITPDGKTLIVGQSFARDLVAFDIAADGAISNRRQWADLGTGVPDGICLDAEGAVWYADPVHGGCTRVGEGYAGDRSEALSIVETADLCFACMLGGPERRHLFMLTASTSGPEETIATLGGQIHVVEVEVPGAGWP